MKKYILILITLCVVLTGCGKKEEVEQPKPKLTLDIMAELLPEKVAYKELNCTPLKNNQVVGTYNDKILLSNGYLYTFGQLFSNQEYCTLTIDMNFKKVLEGGYLLGTVNKLYSTYDYKQNTYATNISSAGFVNWAEIRFTDAESQIYKSSSSYKNGSSTSYSYVKFYVLKPDGCIYEIIYKITTITKNKKTTKTASVASEKLLYSSTDYGTITDFGIDNGTIKSINLIISKKGIYTLKQIETEECLKYADIQCQTKMTLVTDYSYEKYKDQIKYYDKNYVITNKNSIIPTKIVFNLNDGRKNYERYFEGYED